MNIEELTLKQIRELRSLFDNEKCNQLNGGFLNKKVIIRTYSAGVWFGLLSKKEGNEVILKNARRMWRWWCKKSISLSGVARYGINEEKSKICGPVDYVVLTAIEILGLSDDSIKSIEEAAEAEQE